MTDKTKILGANSVINNHMNTKPSEPVKKPDDQAGVHVQAVIKIFDPESKEVFVEKRA